MELLVLWVLWTIICPKVWNLRQKGDRKKTKEGVEEQNNEEDGEIVKTQKKCKSCGLLGHVQRSHHACLMNKKNLVIQTGKLRFFSVPETTVEHVTIKFSFSHIYLYHKREHYHPTNGGNHLPTNHLHRKWKFWCWWWRPHIGPIFDWDFWPFGRVDFGYLGIC